MLSLYTPTAEEIESVATSAKRRHGNAASRIDKAAEIISAGSLQLDTLAWDKCQLPRWKVASQSGKGCYVVTNGACPCADRRHNGVSYCKHAIAAHLYSKILNNRLNAAIQARQVDLGICVDKSFNLYASRLGFCHVHKVGMMNYTFADAASMVRFSMWLAAQPVAVENWPSTVAVAA